MRSVDPLIHMGYALEIQELGTLCPAPCQPRFSWFAV